MVDFGTGPGWRPEGYMEKEVEGDAVSEQSATEIHARQAPEDSPAMGQAHEQETVQKTPVPAKEEEVDYLTHEQPLGDPVWQGMTRGHFVLISKYIRFAADRLGLRDWQFFIRHHPIPADDDALASVTCIHGQRRATIRLNQEFADSSEPRQRHALIHELLHCHMDGMQEVIWTINTLVGQPAYTAIRESHNLAVEFAVDAIATEVAKMLPSMFEFEEED